LGGKSGDRTWGGGTADGGSEGTERPPWTERDIQRENCKNFLPMETTKTKPSREGFTKPKGNKKSASKPGWDETMGGNWTAVVGREGIGAVQSKPAGNKGNVKEAHGFGRLSSKSTALGGGKPIKGRGRRT